MSTALIDLDDRIVTDTGSVVAKYELLLHRAFSGEPFVDLPTVDHPDVHRYVRRSGKRMRIWHDDGKITGPSPNSYAWNIPEEYQAVDIAKLCVDIAESRGYTSDEYANRLADELALIEDRQMVEFFRCLVYITDTFRRENVVWGVGRGSSCASLVLFLLGVNKVDPVKYNIQMEEFYK